MQMVAPLGQPSFTLTTESGMRALFHRSFRTLLRLHDVTISIGYQLGSMALAVIVAIFAYEVVMRYFLGAPTKWASDSVSFLLLISVFLSFPMSPESMGTFRFLYFLTCSTNAKPGYCEGSVFSSVPGFVFGQRIFSLVKPNDCTCGGPSRSQQSSFQNGSYSHLFSWAC